jgi:predicted DsbA family dithiol-disulfide isomerase
MPAAVVTVWFDYACPHSYIGVRQLEESASDIEFEIDRRPFLVRSDSLEFTGDVSVPNDGELPGDASRRSPLYLPGKSIGTEPASNRSVSTLAVHAATAYAKERGRDSDFFWAASREHWELGTDLGNLYTLRRLSLSIGLDWAEMWPELQSGSYHNLVLARHEEALVAGVVRTPSYRVGDRLHSGPISQEELRAAVQTAE